ncbi:MAG: hypothetical protein AB4042_15500 [Leptolyngbyaceae cyanobacterium]
MANGFGRAQVSVRPSIARTLKSTLLDEMKGLDDPRIRRKPEHLLVDIVTIGNTSCLS